MEQRIQKLRSQIQELQEWKNDFFSNQLKLPIDSTSKKIISTDLLVSKGETTSTLTVTHMIEVMNPLDGKLYWIYAVLDN